MKAGFIAKPLVNKYLITLARFGEIVAPSRWGGGNERRAKYDA
jgi:hypothetical protein